MSNVPRALESGEMEILGLIQDSSNYTFLARVGSDQQSVRAIYKPCKGETPLWDFPDGTLYKREVAAYLVSEALGLELVPPTIVRDGPHGIGSVQLFIEADPTLHYLNMPHEFDDVFRRVCAFDLLINNADRKAGHCLLERSTNRIWFVDHGVSFHSDPKLRTVIWDFAGQKIPAEVLDAIARFTPGPMLEALLSTKEIHALQRRAGQITQMKVFPEPGPGRPFPWPPI